MRLCVDPMPVRPQSVPGTRSFDAELTDRISQLHQQEGHAYAEEYLSPPSAHPSHSHSQLAKLIQKYRKGDDYLTTVLSPAPLRAPTASPLPFWKSSSLNLYPCTSPAAGAISTDSVSAGTETETERLLDSEVPWDEVESTIDVSGQQLDELTQKVQQIAAWNDLSAQLTFSKLQTITPPCTPTPFESQHPNTPLQSRVPSRQPSYDMLEETEKAEEGEDMDEERAGAMRAATPTVQIPAENSVNTCDSSRFASVPNSPSSGPSQSSTATPPPSFASICAAPSLYDRCINVSSVLRRSLQDLDSCLPMLLEELQRQQVESALTAKRKDHTIEALEKEVQRLKAENERLLLERKPKYADAYLPQKN